MRLYRCVFLPVSAYSQNVLTKDGFKEKGRCVVQGDRKYVCDFVCVCVCCSTVIMIRSQCPQTDIQMLYK